MINLASIKDYFKLVPAIFIMIIMLLCISKNYNLIYVCILAFIHAYSLLLGINSIKKSVILQQNKEE